MNQNDLLLKLRRQYSESEVVPAMNKQLAEKEIEVGQLKSEIDYLNQQLSAFKKDMEILIVKKVREHPMWTEQKRLVRECREKIYNIHREVSSLKAEITKLKESSNNQSKLK